MKYRWLFIIVPSLTAFLFNGCTGSQGSPTTQSPGVNDIKSLELTFINSGAQAENVGEVTQPFFSVPGRRLSVDGGEIQVFDI